MNRPSRSSTETGIVTRLVSTLITSFSSKMSGVAVASGRGDGTLRPPCNTGGPPGLLETVSLPSVGGTGVGATRGRVELLDCAIAKLTIRPRKMIPTSAFFITISSLPQSPNLGKAIALIVHYTLSLLGICVEPRDRQIVKTPPDRI